MEKGKLYSFEIKGWKEPICGIVEAFSVDWIFCDSEEAYKEMLSR